MSQDWIDDCMQFYGKVLTGKYAHWCHDWDELPIDETCEEFKYCTCYGNIMTQKLFDEKLAMMLNIIKNPEASDPKEAT